MITGTPVPPTCTLQFSGYLESAIHHWWAQGPKCRELTDLVLLVAEQQIEEP